MKTKNKFFIILFIIILLLITIFIYAQTNKNKICFEKNCFKVEIVSTQEELEKGLMFRNSLNKNSGMLFIFPEENFYSFWMKNTLIPLDIIWINSDKEEQKTGSFLTNSSSYPEGHKGKSQIKEIVFIKHNAQPCLEENCEIFMPNKKAKYVLEINSGISEKIGLEVGDGVKFKIKN